MKKKLKGRHFDTLTEHDIQDTFQNWQKRWELCILAEADEGGGGQ
jgi:hypothetical protein